MKIHFPNIEMVRGLAGEEDQEPEKVVGGARGKEEEKGEVGKGGEEGGSEGGE